jgi:hypothetical protein
MSLQIPYYDPKLQTRVATAPKKLRHSDLEKLIRLEQKRSGTWEIKLGVCNWYQGVTPKDLEAFKEQGLETVFSHSKNIYLADPKTAELIKRQMPRNSDRVAYGNLIGSDGVGAALFSTELTQADYAEPIILANDPKDSGLDAAEPDDIPTIFPRQTKVLVLDDEQKIDLNLLNQINQDLNINLTEDKYREIFSKLGDCYSLVSDEAAQATGALPNTPFQHRIGSPEVSGETKGTIRISQLCQELGVDAIMSASSFKASKNNEGVDTLRDIPENLGVRVLDNFQLTRKSDAATRGQKIGLQAALVAPVSTEQDLGRAMLQEAKELKDALSDPETALEHYKEKTERKRDDPETRDEIEGAEQEEDETHQPIDPVKQVIQNDPHGQLAAHRKVIEKLSGYYQKEFKDTVLNGIESPAAMAAPHAALKPWEFCCKDLPHGAIITCWRSPLPNIAAMGVLINNTKILEQQDPEAYQQEGTIYLNAKTAKDVLITDFDGDCNVMDQGYQAADPDQLIGELRTRLGSIDDSKVAYEAAQDLFREFSQPFTARLRAELEGIDDSKEAYDAARKFLGRQGNRLADTQIVPSGTPQRPWAYELTAEALDKNRPEVRPVAVNKEKKLERTGTPEECAIHAADNPTGLVANLGMKIDAMHWHIEACIEELPVEAKEALLSQVASVYRKQDFQGRDTANRFKTKVLDLATALEKLENLPDEQRSANIDATWEALQTINAEAVEFVQFSSNARQLRQFARDINRLKVDESATTLAEQESQVLALADQYKGVLEKNAEFSTQEFTTATYDLNKAYQQRYFIGSEAANAFKNQVIALAQAPEVLENLTGVERARQIEACWEQVQAVDKASAAIATTASQESEAIERLSRLVYQIRDSETDWDAERDRKEEQLARFAKRYRNTLKGLPVEFLEDELIIPKFAEYESLFPTDDLEFERRVKELTKVDRPADLSEEERQQHVDEQLRNVQRLLWDSKNIVSVNLQRAVDLFKSARELAWDMEEFAEAVSVLTQNTYLDNRKKSDFYKLAQSEDTAVRSKPKVVETSLRDPLSRAVDQVNKVFMEAYRTGSLSFQPQSYFSQIFPQDAFSSEQAEEAKEWVEQYNKGIKQSKLNEARSRTKKGRKLEGPHLTVSLNNQASLRIVNLAKLDPDGESPIWDAAKTGEKLGVEILPNTDRKTYLDFPFVACLKGEKKQLGFLSELGIETQLSAPSQIQINSAAPGQQSDQKSISIRELTVTLGDGRELKIEDCKMPRYSPIWDIAQNGQPLPLEICPHDSYAVRIKGEAEPIGSLNQESAERLFPQKKQTASFSKEKIAEFKLEPSLTQDQIKADQWAASQAIQEKAASLSSEERFAMAAALWQTKNGGQTLAMTVFTPEVCEQLQTLQYTQFRVVGLDKETNQHKGRVFGDQQVPVEVAVNTDPDSQIHGRRLLLVDGKPLGVLTPQGGYELPIGTKAEAIITSKQMMPKTVKATLLDSKGEDVQIAVSALVNNTVRHQQLLTQGQIPIGEVMKYGRTEAGDGPADRLWQGHEVVELALVRTEGDRIPCTVMMREAGGSWKSLGTVKEREIRIPLWSAIAEHGTLIPEEDLPPSLSPDDLTNLKAIKARLESDVIRTGTISLDPNSIKLPGKDPTEVEEFPASLRTWAKALKKQWQEDRQECRDLYRDDPNQFLEGLAVYYRSYQAEIQLSPELLPEQREIAKTHLHYSVGFSLWAEDFSVRLQRELQQCQVNAGDNEVKLQMEQNKCFKQYSQEITRCFPSSQEQFWAAKHLQDCAQAPEKLECTFSYQQAYHLPNQKQSRNAYILSTPFDLAEQHRQALSEAKIPCKALISDRSPAVDFMLKLTPKFENYVELYNHQDIQNFARQFRTLSTRYQDGQLDRDSLQQHLEQQATKILRSAIKSRGQSQSAPEKYEGCSLLKLSSQSLEQLSVLTSYKEQYPQDANTGDGLVLKPIVAPQDIESWATYKTDLSNASLMHRLFPKDICKRVIDLVARDQAKFADHELQQSAPANQVLRAHLSPKHTQQFHDLLYAAAGIPPQQLSASDLSEKAQEYTQCIVDELRQRYECGDRECQIGGNWTVSFSDKGNYIIRDHKQHLVLGGSVVQAQTTTEKKSSQISHPTEHFSPRVPGVSPNPLDEIGPLKSNVANHFQKDRAMAEEATQFIGCSAAQQGIPSSTRKYREAWAKEGLANTFQYGPEDTIMVSGSGPWRGVTPQQIQQVFDSEYSKLLEAAVNAGASFVVGNAKGTDQLVIDYLKSKGYKLESQKVEGNKDIFWRCTPPAERKNQRIIEPRNANSSSEQGER